MTYQDTIKPEIISAKVNSSTQISIELSEICSSFDDIIIQTADSLQIESGIFAHSLIDNELKIISEPLDTLEYHIVMSKLSDTKNNVKQETSVLIDGITIQDTISPVILFSSPKNGAALNTLKPEFQITFSEIIYSENVTAVLISNEDRSEIKAEVINGDSERFTLQPMEQLVNYSTYTLIVNATDPNGNDLENELSLTFIVITQ